jgi:hypothetical protein
LEDDSHAWVRSTIIQLSSWRCDSPPTASIASDQGNNIMTGHIQTTDWADGVHTLFTTQRVNLIPFVPDGGHKRLIALCQADAAMRTVMLTTEEEGIRWPRVRFWR